MLSRIRFLTVALPESSLQGTSIDLQSALTLSLSRMDKVKSNIGNVTTDNNLIHERVTVQEQNKVSLHLIHQSIKGMIWVRKLGACVRSYVPLIRL